MVNRTQRDGYEEIVVEEGETFTKRVGGGEVWENKLIDITAPGADVTALCDGEVSGWTVRNIGVRGRVKDAYFFSPAGSGGLVENVYLGDGSISKNTWDGRPKGFWVQHNRTTGPIEFRNVHVAKFTNNGIYGSPTVDSHSGGVIHIRDSYFNSNNISQFKIGSPLGTCEVENVTVRTDQPAPPNPDGVVNKRAMIALASGGDQTYTVVRDSDIQGHIDADDPGATVELQNVRWDGSGSGDIRGQSAGSPDLDPPAGVPMTAQEAAAGTSRSDGSGDGGGSGDRNEVVVFVPEGVLSVEYTMTVNGPVERTRLSERIGAGQNDTIVDNGDGTWTVQGLTGNGFGDAFLVDGQVTSFSATDQAELRVNGDVISNSQLPYPPTGGGGGGGGGGDGDDDGQARKVAVAVALATGVYGLSRVQGGE